MFFPLEVDGSSGPPWGVASLEPRGFIGRMVSEKKIFLSFSHYKLYISAWQPS